MSTHESTYLTVTMSGSSTGAFQFSPYDSGMVFIPSGWTDANISFQAAYDDGATYSFMRDSAGSLIEISGISTSLARWYNFPAGVVAPRFLKLISNASGEETLTEQSSPETLYIMLKS